ncbi:MAG TPA: hypothetical protein VHM64_08855 [Candidatus Binatia bacterium]|nr:hypothetical protein [Candidatus Binatia bacterium]
MKQFKLTVIIVLGVVLAPGLQMAASEVVIGDANISARVSPLWIAQEKGFFFAPRRSITSRRGSRPIGRRDVVGSNAGLLQTPL